MTKTEFQQATKTLVGDELILMVDYLQIPYRTFQSYYYGTRSMPDAVAKQVKELLEKDRLFFAGMGDRIDRDFNNRAFFALNNQKAMEFKTIQKG